MPFLLFNDACGERLRPGPLQHRAWTVPALRLTPHDKKHPRQPAFAKYFVEHVDGRKRLSKQEHDNTGDSLVALDAEKLAERDSNRLVVEETDEYFLDHRQ